ncbi:MAG: hypothetical protein ACRDBG_26105, partial [Waterburya sp.]
KLCPPEKALAGLLHDAAEAYLGDIPTPIKAVLPDYKRLEKISEEVIFKKYGVTLDSDIKDADTRMLYIEASCLLLSQGRTWQNYEEIKHCTEFIPVGLMPKPAYTLFMNRYYELTNDQNIARNKKLSSELRSVRVDGAFGANC